MKNCAYLRKNPGYAPDMGVGSIIHVTKLFLLIVS